MPKVLKVLKSTITAFFVLTVSVTAWAQPDPTTVGESVVQVVVIDSGDTLRIGSGFVIAANGYVLTAAHLVANEDRIVAVPLTTGAELLARVVYLNERADLALLSVNGLGLPPLTLASTGFEPGRRVYSAGVWDDSVEPIFVATSDEDITLSFTEGAVGKHDDLAATDGSLAVPLIEHNAMIPAAGYGGPLLNECGEVAGLNRGSPGVTAWRLRRGQGPEGVVHAVRITAVAGLLQPQGVEFIQSETECASALSAAQAEVEETAERLEQTEQEREQAATRASEAESRVSNLEEQYQEAVRTGAEQTEELRTELDAARNEQEAARAAVGTLENELDALEQRIAKEATAGRQRLIATILIGTVLVLVIAIVAFVVSRQRSRQLTLAQMEAVRARQEAAAARTEAREPEPTLPDCLLTGETGDGRPIAVKIPGSLLSGDGAIIGRSPRNSTLLIDDRMLSREHARLFGEEDTLYIEDLDTTNGTKVNGLTLNPRTPVAIFQGDAIELGGVQVELVRAG